MNFELTLFSLFGLGLIVAPFGWYWWNIIRTKHWLIAEADVINEDDGYSIEYEVKGKIYKQTPDIESNIRVGGIKVFKAPIIPKNFHVRYDPYRPNDYAIGHVHTKPFIITISIVCIIFGLLLTFGVIK